MSGAAPSPEEATLALIEMLSDAVEELSRGYEQFAEILGLGDDEEGQQNLDQVLLYTLTLSNTARMFLAQARANG